MPAVIQKLFCKPNYNNWPYGIQNCTFKVGSYHFPPQELRVIPQDPPTHSDQLMMSQIDVISTKIWPDENKGQITVSIAFEGSRRSYSSPEHITASSDGQRIQIHSSVLIFFSLLSKSMLI